MPTATDLVTDLPADFEVFGQAVATSMADLLGGTSGQILSKASNTDMDFTWIANDQGDITAVNVTSPITGGGTAGAVTVGIQDASTSQKGSVQLSDSTSTTSSVLAATPTAVKSSYDLAAAAIPKSTVTTAGDTIYGTGSSAVTRLGIGSTGQVLTVAAGLPSWATPAGGFTYANYTPTFTGFTKGNANIIARYAQSGKAVNVFVSVTLGTTSSVTGSITVSLPVTASSNSIIYRGIGGITDAGVRVFSMATEVISTTAFELKPIYAALTYAAEDYVSASLPMVWTTNDAFFTNFTYEAA